MFDVLSFALDGRLDSVNYEGFAKHTERQHLLVQLGYWCGSRFGWFWGWLKGEYGKIYCCQLLLVDFWERPRYKVMPKGRGVSTARML